MPDTIRSLSWIHDRRSGAEVKRQRRIPEAEQAGTSAAAGARDGGRRVTGTGYGLRLGSG